MFNLIENIGRCLWAITDRNTSRLSLSIQRQKNEFNTTNLPGPSKLLALGPLAKNISFRTKRPNAYVPLNAKDYTRKNRDRAVSKMGSVVRSKRKRS